MPCIFARLRTRKEASARTTVHNLGMALSCQVKTLLVGLDAQGNLTDACGLTAADIQASSYAVMAGDRAASEDVRVLSDTLHLLPASRDLAWPSWPLRHAWGGKIC